MKVERVVQVSPLPMIQPFPLFLKVTTPPSFISRVTDYVLSPIMCLEQPQLRYQSLFFFFWLQDKFTRKNYVEALSVQVILDPFRLAIKVPFGTYTFLTFLFNFLKLHK